MFNLFTKNNFSKVSQSLLENLKKEDFWLLANINRNNFKNSTNTRELDFYSPTLTQFKLALEKDNYLYFSATDKILYDAKLATEELYVLNNYFEQMIQKEFNFFTTKLNETKLINPLNRETEFKALEWIKVSFKVLKEALASVKKEKDYLNSFQFFMGKNPKSDLHEIRVIIHNLDIQYTLLNDGNLRIKIWNDKDQGFGSNKTPVLTGDFSELKREMFDELIQIFVELKSSIHFIS